MGVLSGGFKRRVLSAVVAGAIGLAGPARAAVEEPVAAERVHEVLRRGACLLCHQPNGERIGPSFREIARRYAGGGAKARDTIVWRIRQGGVGNFSPVPMGPCDATRLSDEELSLAVDHILNGRH